MECEVEVPYFELFEKLRGNQARGGRTRRKRSDRVFEVMLSAGVPRCGDVSYPRGTQAEVAQKSRGKPEIRYAIKKKKDWNELLFIILVWQLVNDETLTHASTTVPLLNFPANCCKKKKNKEIKL